MGRGGRRVGAGRKPKPKGPGVVFSFETGEQQNPPLPGLSDDPDHSDINLLEPPAELGERARAAWSAMAPAAIEQQTLDASTTWGFRRLCVLWERTLQLDADLAAAPAAERAGIHNVALKLETRLDAALARFKLTGFGKPADKNRPQGQVLNPWAELAQ